MEQVDVEDPLTYEVVQRTLDIQGVAKQASDSVNVNSINYFGKQGENLGEALLALLEALEAGGDAEPPEGLEEAVQQAARQRGLRGFLGSDPEGILERLEKWGQEKIGRRLPLQVNQITIHPEEMPMSTLQFTERLGYRKGNAIEMLTMGCYNALWTLLASLDEGGKNFDEKDRVVLDLVRKWTGVEELPEDPQVRKDLQNSWRCQRTACVYHASHCPKGSGE